MSERVIASVVERLIEAELIGEQLTICWHAGEPLSLPVDYYERAIALVRCIIPSDCQIEFKFQTNGMLISEEWCEFFRRHDIHIGLSIDGPAELHDANRRTRSGKGTFNPTIRGLRLLKKHGVTFNIICVLTNTSMKDARTLYDFFCNEGVDHVCFNIEETEGIHRSKLIAAGDSAEQFRAFYREYVHLTLGAGRLHWVREIDAPFRVLFTTERDRTWNQQVTPFAIVTVDWEGNLSTFSPELIGMPASEFDDFKYGNVLHDSIATMQKSSGFQGTLKAIHQGVELCRNSCEYFPICGGGAPSNKFFENGTLSSSETAYCRSIIKTTADIILETIATRPDLLGVIKAKEAFVAAG